VVALLGRFERGGRDGGADAGTRPPSTWTQIAGALLVSLGLALLASYGMSTLGAPHVRVVPLGMALIGAALILRR
jgi:hypothetical protein